MHECNRQTRREFVATTEEPYHFTSSGLSNVFLVGMKYYRCECGEVAAEIPAIKQLLMLIARDLVEKADSLAPEEVRFLRKRIRKSQAEFAKQIGLRPETLSRMERGETRTNERTDKLIRFTYALQSDDSLLLDQLRKAADEMLEQWRHSGQPSKIVATVKNKAWESERVAA